METAGLGSIRNVAKLTTQTVMRADGLQQVVDAEGNVCMYVCMYGFMNVCMYVWIDGWMDVCMD